MTYVMEGLYRVDKNNQPIDEVAINMGKYGRKTYTFHIRDNAKWSNGDLVSVKDFEYSLKKSIDPEHGSEYAYIMCDFQNAVAIKQKKIPNVQLGVKAIDDKTFQVQLESPVPYILKLVTFPTFYPQKEKFIEEQGKKYELEANTGTYNGPFSLSEWKHDVSFKLTNNDQYWDKSTVKVKKAIQQYRKRYPSSCRLIRNR
ncbi:ABC transporter substrate-binding protein [Gottfriedia sp. OAE603]|uniref:ABC transporter substrate-binding protein n=1 Tax=Gottfriedia sp. OAE603 TaxID=2663872 RepID=UPI001789C263